MLKIADELTEEKLQDGHDIIHKVSQLSRTPDCLNLGASFSYNQVILFEKQQNVLRTHTLSLE